MDRKKLALILIAIIASCIIILAFIDYNNGIDALEFDVSLYSQPQEGEPFIINCTLTNIGTDSMNITFPELGSTIWFKIRTPEGTVSYSGGILDMVPVSMILEPGHSYEWHVVVSPGSAWEDTTLPSGQYSIKATYNSIAKHAISGTEYSNTLSFDIE